MNLISFLFIINIFFIMFCANCRLYMAPVLSHCTFRDLENCSVRHSCGCVLGLTDTVVFVLWERDIARWQHILQTSFPLGLFSFLLVVWKRRGNRWNCNPVSGAPLWTACVSPLTLSGANCISLPMLPGRFLGSGTAQSFAEMFRNRMNYEVDLDIAPRPMPGAPLHGSNH